MRSNFESARCPQQSRLNCTYTLPPHLSQSYCKTVEGWLALAQVVRYHQPPSRRVSAITFDWRDEIWPGETEEAKALLREVLPTLTSRGSFRNIYQVSDACTESAVVSTLSLLKRSHITHATLVGHDAGAVFADALIPVLQTGRLRALTLPFAFCSGSAQPERVVETVNTVPGARSLVAVEFMVSNLAGARALLALTDRTASHALERVYVQFFDHFEPDTDLSPFRLVTIPSLRILVIGEDYMPFLTPAHFSILVECLRARAQSGSPLGHACIWY